MLHRLLRQVVGLEEAVQSQAFMGANRVLGEQCHQDGFHHPHGNVLAHAGPRAGTEGLKVPAGSLEGGKRGGRSKLFTPNLSHLVLGVSV